MLILVGVTVTVALNGGLFSSAQRATSQTQIEAEKEQLLASVMGAYNAQTRTVDAEKLQIDLKDWTIEDGETILCTSPKGNQFEVSRNGTIKKAGVGEWIQTGTTIKKENEDGTVIELMIGDYVNYTPSGSAESVTVSGDESGTGIDQTVAKRDDFSWRVLGVTDDGEIKLISYASNPYFDADKKIEFSGDTGYLNSNDILDNICNTFYGAGNKIEESRNLNLDEILEFTGINKNNLGMYYKFTYENNDTPEDESDDYIAYSISTDYNETTGEGTWSTKNEEPMSGMKYSVYLNGEVWNMEDKTKEYIFKDEQFNVHTEDYIEGYTRNGDKLDDFLRMETQGVWLQFHVTVPNKEKVQTVTLSGAFNNNININTNKINWWCIQSSSMGSIRTANGLMSLVKENEFSNFGGTSYRPVIILKSSVELEPAVDESGNEIVGTWDIVE